MCINKNSVGSVIREINLPKVCVYIASVRACVRVCVRACVHVCVHVHMHACVRVLQQNCRSPMLHSFSSFRSQSVKYCLSENVNIYGMLSMYVAQTVPYTNLSGLFLLAKQASSPTQIPYT